MHYTKFVMIEGSTPVATRTDDVFVDFFNSMPMRNVTFQTRGSKFNLTFEPTEKIKDLVLLKYLKKNPINKLLNKQCTVHAAIFNHDNNHISISKGT